MTGLIWSFINGNCASTMAAMSDHADGELRGYRRFRTLRHLARCERCRAVFESLRATIQGLRALGSEEPPPPRPELAVEVVRRIRERQE